MKVIEAIRKRNIQKGRNRADMSEWSVVGRIHMLIADPKDMYESKILARLSLDRFLYFQLKKDGYDGIFFVKEEPGRFGISMEDKKSASWRLPLIRESGWLYAKKNQNDFLEQYQVEDKYCNTYYAGLSAEKCRPRQLAKARCVLKQWIDAMMNSYREKRFAFFLPFSLIYQLYLSEEELDQLENRLRETQSILVFCMDFFEEHGFALLAKEDNAFARKIGTSSVHSKTVASIYERLKKEWGNRIHLYEPIDRERVRYTLERGILLSGWDMKWEEREDFTSFIYAWYHSDAFQEAYKNILPDRKEQYSRYLAQILEKKQTRYQIRECVKGLRKGDMTTDLLAIIQKKYVVQMGAISYFFVREANPIRTRWKQLCMEQLLDGEALEKAELENTYYQLETVLEGMRYADKDEENIWENMYYLEEMQQAHERDSFLVRQLFQWIQYSIFEASEHAEQEDASLRKSGYQLNLSHAKRIHEIQYQTLSDLIKKQKKAEQQYQEALQDYRADRQLYELSDEELLKNDIDSSRKIVLQDEIKLKKKQLDNVNRSIITCRETILKLKTFIVENEFPVMRVDWKEIMEQQIRYQETVEQTIKELR